MRVDAKSSFFADVIILKKSLLLLENDFISNGFLVRFTSMST